MFRVFQGQLMDLRRDLFVQLDSLNKNLHDLRMDVLRRGKKKVCNLTLYAMMATIVAI